MSGSSTSRRSGAATVGIGSGPRPSNTRGKPPASSARVTPVTSRPADGGTTPSMVVTTLERATRARKGCGPPWRTAPATTQTTRTAAASTTTSPRKESTPRATGACTASRNRRPGTSRRA